MSLNDEKSACSWRVGQAVRVHSSNRAIARRGIISVVHSLPTSIDVIYEKPLKNVNTAETSGDEEERVDTSRISVLLDFESNPSMDVSSAFVLKSNANTLFGLRDYQSALDLYKKAMDRLVGGVPMEIGCLVLVSYSDSVDVRTGMIADLDSSVYDVMLDAANGQPHSDDEVMVTADRLLVLALSPVDRWLQRSLYLNMARCASKLSLKGWAVKYASIALAISSFQSVAHPDAASTTASIDNGICLGASNSDSEVDVAGLLADCLYFRGRSLLNACRPQMARKAR